MKSNVRRIKKYRRFSKEFKQKVVSEYESGRSSTKELSLANGISQQTIYRWIYQLSNYSKQGIRIVEKANSQEEGIKRLHKENKDLKAIVGEKQIQIEYLERLIKIAEAELKIDIKKNFCTPQSNILK